MGVFVGGKCIYRKHERVKNQSFPFEFVLLFYFLYIIIFYLYYVTRMPIRKTI